ncbi:MAG: LLM class flavin-dependent oxidoreductase, partial [Candidatus Binataceae bacterium]
MSTDIDQAAGQHALEELALLGSLTDRVRLSLLRVNVAIGARDVDVAAKDERSGRIARAGGIVLDRLQKTKLGGVVLAPVRYVDGGDQQTASQRLDDPSLVVERRMRESGLFSEAILAQMQADAGIGGRSMPVTPVAGQATERFGDLLALRFELLQAEDVGTLSLDELDQLAPTSANAVDVPGDDLHGTRLSRKEAFDYIWAPEHHFTEYGFCASPMLTLAAMASVTKRVRLGSA